METENLIETECRSCHHPLTGEYCSNCGQKRYRRIDRQYILNALQGIIFKMDKGFLYSLKSVLLNPGKTAKEFIEGDRQKHYKPLSLVFLLSAISMFISFKMLKLHERALKNVSEDQGKSFVMDSVMSQISSNYPLFMLLSLPIFALGTKLVFRKWGHNYYEHIVMNSYVLAFSSLFSIFVSFPILYFIDGNFQMVTKFSLYSNLIYPIILTWFFKTMYPEKKLISIIGRVFLFLWIIFFFFIIAIVIAVVITLILNPEGLRAV